MIYLLYLIAALIVGYGIFAPIFSVIPFSWTFLATSIALATLFVALANILGNQAEILDKLDRQENRQKLLPREKKLCERCNHSYDIDYKSCPKCGNAG